MEIIIRLVDSFGKIGKSVIVAIMGAFTVSVVVSLLVALNLIDISTLENAFKVTTFLDFVLNAFR